MKVLILEDNDRIKEGIRNAMPTEVNYKIVSNEKAFVEHLNSEQKADLYFLDDNIPNIEGKQENLFTKNFQLLKEKYPDAEVYYIGSFQANEQVAFCDKNNVEMIDKSDLFKKVQQCRK